MGESNEGFNGFGGLGKVYIWSIFFFLRCGILTMSV